MIGVQLLGATMNAVALEDLEISLQVPRLRRRPLKRSPRASSLRMLPIVERMDGLRRIDGIIRGTDRV